MSPRSASARWNRNRRARSDRPPRPQRREASNVPADLSPAKSLCPLPAAAGGGSVCLRCALHTAVQCGYERQPAGGAARCCRSAGPIWNKHEECGTHAIRTCFSITGAAWNAVQEHHTPESALRPKPRPDETERGIKHSAEHRPPKPALRPEPRPDETERGIKHSAEHRPPERRPLLRKSKRKIRSTQNIVFRRLAPPGPRPEFPRGEPEPGRMPRRGGTVRSGRSRGRGRSRSRGRGRFPPDTLRRHIRGSAAGPRAYTRKTERGIRMHELPSLRFTPAVTTATPVRSPPKRSPRLRRPRSWAQPSL